MAAPEASERDVLARHGLGPDDVLAELARREGTSGHDEKAARGR